jgi:4a-hydroxytetrahydrobiopterin dehydratase
MSWLNNGSELSREIVFENQLTLAKFVVEIARISDEMNHHADMEIHYNRLKMIITTHDEGGLTDSDFLLCERVDEVLKKGN